MTLPETCYEVCYVFDWWGRSSKERSDFPSFSWDNLVPFQSSLSRNQNSQICKSRAPQHSKLGYPVIWSLHSACALRHVHCQVSQLVTCRSPISWLSDQGPGSVLPPACPCNLTALIWCPQIPCWSLMPLSLWLAPSSSLVPYSNFGLDAVIQSPKTLCRAAQVPGQPCPSSEPSSPALGIPVCCNSKPLAWQVE